MLLYRGSSSESSVVAKATLRYQDKVLIAPIIFFLQTTKESLALLIDIGLVVEIINKIWPTSYNISNLNEITISRFI